MICNGCGNEIELPAATFSYGEANVVNGGAVRDRVSADHHKELCPKCARVMKDILLNSDLSEHWDDE